MNDVILLKMNLLGGMDTYVREVIGDDDITDVWNMYGVPDECDEDTLREIAEDDSKFTRICILMGKLVKASTEEDEDF